MKKNLIYAVLVFVAITALISAWVYAQTSNTSLREVKQTSSYVAPEVQHTDNTQVTSNRIQIALILDTSGSMDGLINQAKSQLWKIVNELTKATKDSVEADISIALYEYGNDDNSVTEGYIRQISPFTQSLDELSANLFELSTNGGSEYCGQVLQTSVDKLAWTESDSALKIIYIAGNEEFTQGSYSYVEACTDAKKENITINTIFCGDYNEGIRTYWKHGAEITGGSYLNIDHDASTVFISTPYDDQINTLNLSLNQTYVYYGSKGKQHKSNQVEQDDNQLKISRSNSASRVLSKSSRLYDNSFWDLVDAYNSDNEVIDDIDIKTLPDSLQTLSRAEIEEVVKAKNDQRNKIKSEIQGLGLLREQFITQVGDSSSTSSTLGEGMINSIRNQAVSKGFTFNKN